MHQGPIDVATNDHELGVLRLSEIEDAHRISEGPFFVVSVNETEASVQQVLSWKCDKKKKSSVKFLYVSKLAQKLLLFKKQILRTS